MTMISHSDKALTQRNSMFEVAVKAAARHKFGLAFHISHMDRHTREPQGWVREQLEHIRGRWTTKGSSFPDIFFNEGIPVNEVWPVRDRRPIRWSDAVNSTNGLGRLAKLYVGGDE